MRVSFSLAAFPVRRPWQRARYLDIASRAWVTTCAVDSGANESNLRHWLRNSRALCQETWRTAIESTKSQCAIDATAGRGSDTLILCELLGSSGLVIALDIQESAVRETRERYNAAVESGQILAPLETLRVSHEDLHMSTALSKSSVACIVYNLGWYPGPGADRSIVTRPHSTIASLRSAEHLLEHDGVISVTTYPGHPGGKEEERAVLKWAQTLDPHKWTCSLVSYPNRNAAPSVLSCQKIRR